MQNGRDIQYMCNMGLVLRMENLQTAQTYCNVAFLLLVIMYCCNTPTNIHPSIITNVSIRIIFSVLDGSNFFANSLVASMFCFDDNFRSF